jgi:CRISPR-associated endoribonuclease Cas6
MPYDHSYQLYSSIIKLVSSKDKDKAEKLHIYNSGFKFNLSQIMPGGKRKFTRTGFSGERYIFMISSVDSDLIIYLKQLFSSSKEINIFNHAFRIHSVTNYNVHPSSEIITLNTRSPVILKEKNKYLFNESEDEILAAIEKNIISKHLKVIGRKPNIKFIKIVSLKRKKVELKGIKLPAFMLKLAISSDLEVLKFLLDVGLGSKNQLGFGFLEEEKHGDNFGV